MRWFSRFGVLALPLILLAACDGRSSVAYGDANSIVLIASDSLWEEAGPTVEEILEPRIQTVRAERTFELTPVSPSDPDLQNLRLWRQLLVIGEPADPWVARVVGDGAELPETLPAVVERDDIWARGQRVTAVVLPPGGGAAELVGILPEVHELLDQRFRAYVQSRMFVSGRNDSLRVALREEAGFELLVPSVYQVQNPASDAYIFRNDNSIGGELARVVQVTWRPGAVEEMTEDEVLSWRKAASTGRYYPEQSVQSDLLESDSLDGIDGGLLEVRGAWAGEIDGFPMAGPFITRVVSCPAQDRTYLLDSWLYAPGRGKYEYLLQLETILGTFACDE